MRLGAWNEGGIPWKEEASGLDMLRTKNYPDREKLKVDNLNDFLLNGQKGLPGYYQQGAESFQGARGESGLIFFPG